MELNAPLSSAPETPAADVGGPDFRAHRGRYQEAFEFAPDAQLVTDRLGVILEANHAAAALLGHRKEFLPGKPLALFATDGSQGRFYKCLVWLGRGSPADAFEARLARHGDGPRDAHVVARRGARPGDPPAPGTIHWVARDVTEWLRAEAARADLQRRLATAQEDERRRLSRDLHDTVGQTLTALALGVRAARAAVPPSSPALAALGQVERLTDDLGRQLHELATRLRPTALDDLGLEAAVRQLVADWSARTGVATDFQAIGLTDRRFPLETETALYRVAQEALTNVAKHAAARRIAVVVGRNDDHAVAVIEDDGIGFDPDGDGRNPPSVAVPGERGRLGLLGMRERVALAGGVLEVESARGQGTTVIARIPLPPTRGAVGTDDRKKFHPPSSSSINRESNH